MNTLASDWSGAFAESYAKLMQDPPSNLAKECCIEPGVLQQMGNIRDLSIVDLGCGHGSLTKKMLQRGANVHGIDHSNDMIRLAEKHCNYDPNASFQTADLRLPLGRDLYSVFDMAVSSMVLTNLDDNDAYEAIRNMQKLLKVGGTGYTVVVDQEGSNYLKNFITSRRTESGTIKGNYVWRGEDKNGVTFERYTDFYVRSEEVYISWFKSLGMNSYTIKPLLNKLGREMLADNPEKIRSMDEHPRFSIIISEKVHE